MTAAQPLDGNYKPINNLAVTPGTGYVSPQADLATQSDSVTGNTVAPYDIVIYGQTGATGGVPSVAAERVPVVLKNIAAQAVTAGTPVSIWTPATGKKFRLLSYAISLSVAGSVIFKDNTTEFMRTPLMPAGQGQPAPWLGNGYLSSAANNALQIDVSASGNVSGYVMGCEES